MQEIGPILRYGLINLTGNGEIVLLMYGFTIIMRWY